MLIVLRSLLIVTLLVFGGLLSIIGCLIRPFNPQNTWYVCKLFNFFRPIRTLGIELELRNSEILEKNRPCVFVSNHQSNLDVFVCVKVAPKDTVSIGKKSLRLIPFFGQFYWLAGNILIDRQKRKRAYATMDTAVKAIKKGISIWIFPEGTRSRNRGLLRFKKGAFYTAIKAGSPIVPVVISQYSNIDIKKWNAGKIIVEVLEPMDTTNKTIDDAIDMAKECQENIERKLAELNKELS